MQPAAAGGRRAIPRDVPGMLSQCPNVSRKTGKHLVMEAGCRAFDDVCERAVREHAREGFLGAEARSSCSLSEKKRMFAYEHTGDASSPAQLAVRAHPNHVQFRADAPPGFA